MRPEHEWKVTGRKLALVAAVALGALSLPFARGTDTAGRQPAENQYIGASKCKNCHQSDAAGNQYEAWMGMKHAQAFEVLASDVAHKYGKERGVEDPQKSAECLRCHVTAYGEPAERIKKGFKPDLGVQCETCHGPGNLHMKARFKAAAGADSEGSGYTTIPDDEIIKKPAQETCLKCHNEESPGFQPFCFHERVSKIRHLNPLKPRTPEEQAALLVCGCGEECGCAHGCGEGCGVPPPKKEQ